MSGPTCRACGAGLTTTFVDLGASPVSNANLTADDLRRMEPFYPLHAWVCDACLLVQLEAFEAPEQHFSADYAYFSSYSDSWLAHAKRYVDMTIGRFGLGPASRVIEVASNDGYLLQYFVQRGIPVLGIEPAANVAKAAEARGVTTLTRFFGAELGAELARQGRAADLLLGNNVLAHVPDLNGFVEGLRLALAPRGVVTMEFPHLLKLIQQNQFDTIYHEHFSYLSLAVVQRIFAARGLEVFDVEELPTHGGSLRVFARHTADTSRPVEPAVARVLGDEDAAGLGRIATYTGFGANVHATKRALLAFLIEAAREGKSVAGYGAPAKGNTLLNYCGVRADLLAYTVDRSPQKQGRYLPGTHIPIYAPDKIAETKPDYVLILPWNLRDEIMAQMAHIRSWGGKFVVPIPEVTVIP